MALFDRYRIEPKHITELRGLIEQDRTEVEVKKNIQIIFDHYTCWYRLAAITNRHLYLIFSIVTVLCPVLILYFNYHLTEKSVWTHAIAITSAIGALASGVIQVFRWLDHWTQYRSAIERLKHAGETYVCNGADPDSSKVRKFYDSIMEIVINENAQWDKTQRETIKRP